jgi:hypothetical protein
MIGEELEGSNDVINSFTVDKEEKPRRHDSLTYHTMTHVILTYVFFDTQYSLSCLDRCDTTGDRCDTTTETLKKGLKQGIRDCN